MVQKAANGATSNGTGPAAPKQPKAATFLNRYRELAMDRTYIADDASLAEMWGAAVSSFGSIRSRLKKQGFGFVELEGKIFKVTARPVRAAVEPEPSTTLAPVEPEQPTTQIPITFTIEAQSDPSVNYLAQAREAARGKGTEAMLYGILCALIALAERGNNANL